MSEAPHRNVRAVVEAGAALGVEVRPRQFPDGTRTADDAARAIGVEVGQIVKSLAFRVVGPAGAGTGAGHDGEPDRGSDGEIVMALVSGSNQLDPDKLAAAARAGGAVRADADAVRAATGFPIGGVPPFGHRQPLRVFVDEDLLRYDEVWAAAGTWHDVFPVAPDALVQATAAPVCDLARR